MNEFRLKNITNPGYQPPRTWEEVAELERPQRILAARYFLRQAAIRLHQDAGLHPDDVKMLFDAVPEWIGAQQHAYKREEAELRKVWVCRVEGCQYRGTKREFFKTQDQLTLLDEMPMARCPKCGECDAGEEQQASEDCTHSYERDGLRCDKCGQLRPGTKSFQLERLPEEPCADCEGQPCPVCQGLGLSYADGVVIKDHHCSRCNTYFCAVCHGIASAQLSRAYDEVKRCRC